MNGTSEHKAKSAAAQLRRPATLRAHILLPEPADAVASIQIQQCLSDTAGKKDHGSGLLRGDGSSSQSVVPDRGPIATLTILPSRAPHHEVVQSANARHR